jgi:hypothetical protein
MATLPTPQDFKSIEITSTFPGTSVVTDTGKMYRLNFDGHYFSIQVTYPPMERNETRQVTGFLQSKKGALTEFDCPLDIYSDTSGARATLSEPPVPDLIVSTPLGVGTSIIPYLSYWSNVYYDYNTDGNLINIGDYITFSGHKKVYQITEITNPSSSGAGEVEISPPLQVQVNTTEVINVMGVTMLVFQDGKTMTYSTGIKGFSELAFNFREDV